MTGEDMLYYRNTGSLEHKKVIKEMEIGRDEK